MHPGRTMTRLAASQTFLALFAEFDSENLANLICISPCIEASQIARFSSIISDPMRHADPAVSGQPCPVRPCKVDSGLLAG